MAISFNTIPSNIRVPLFYGEIDNSQANVVNGGSWNAILMGQMLDEASATELTPVIVSQTSQANSIFGRGSQLARMVKAFRQNCPTGQLYCIPVKVTGEKAKARLKIKGTSTEGGYINLYVASDRVRVVVPQKTQDTQIAALMITAVNSQPDLPVTAAMASTGVEATAGVLTGGKITDIETLLEELKLISDGSIVFSIDAQNIEATAIDLQSVLDMDDVAEAITAKLQSKATVTWSVDHFVVTSASKGNSSNVNFCQDAEEGTALSAKLKLTSADGGTTQVGIDAEDISATVELVAKAAGDYANDIRIALDLLGAVGGEKLVNGVSVTITQMQGGAGDVDIDSIIANLGDTAFDFIGVPWNDKNTLDKVALELSDTAGRWSYSRMLYGHALTVKRGQAPDDLNDLVSFGQTFNDQHLACLGIEETFASTVYDVVGALTGLCATYINTDPARPLQSLTLEGIMGAGLGSAFDLTERNTLLLNGIACQSTQVDKTVTLNRLVTTYKTNSYGDADTSYLDSERLWQLSYIQRYVKSALNSKYPRHKIADDGTLVAPGQAVVTPKDLKAELIGIFSTLENLGIIESLASWQDGIVVERNAQDPERVDMLVPANLMNGLRVIAEQTQFRA